MAYLVLTDAPLDNGDLAVLMASPLGWTMYRIPWTGEPESLLSFLRRLAPSVRAWVVLRLNL
jgi:hypothetical protein